MSEQNLYEISVGKITSSNVLPAFKMKIIAATTIEADSIIAEIAEQDGYKVYSSAVLVGSFDPDKQLVTHLDPSLDLETVIVNSLDGMSIQLGDPTDT